MEYLPRIHHIAALQQSPRVYVKNEQECELNANLVSIYARRFSPGRWSFLGPGSEKKWYSTHDSKPQGEWDRVAELMMIKFGESRHPVFRLSRGVLKSKGGGKLSIHFCADDGTIETVFRTLISVSQLSIYGAVSDLGEEYKSCHVRIGRRPRSPKVHEQNGRTRTIPRTNYLHVDVQ